VVKGSIASGVYNIGPPTLPSTLLKVLLYLFIPPISPLYNPGLLVILLRLILNILRCPPLLSKELILILRGE
jgi:hypothetical protein